MSVAARAARRRRTCNCGFRVSVCVCVSSRSVPMLSLEQKPVKYRCLKKRFMKLWIYWKPNNGSSGRRVFERAVLFLFVFVGVFVLHSKATKYRNKRILLGHESNRALMEVLSWRFNISSHFSNLKCHQCHVSLLLSSCCDVYSGRNEYQKKKKKKVFTFFF